MAILNNFKKSQQEIIIKQIEDIDKLIDILQNLDSIKDDIESYIEYDEEREENLEKIGRSIEYDSSAKESLQDMLNLDYCEKLPLLVEKLNDIKNNLENL